MSGPSEAATGQTSAAWAGAGELVQRIENPLLARLLRQWDQLRQGRRMPARQDLQPQDLQYLLGHLFLLDVVQDSGTTRFRYRLFGSSVMLYRGFDLTGRFIDEHPDAGFASEAHRGYLKAMQEGLPLWAKKSGYGVNGMVMDFEALILPLASDGETPDMMLGAQLLRPIAP